ncbi:MAG: peptide chain release factor N(5)-glutamine methyltransferase [bacterium]
MTVREALREGTKALRYFSIPSAELDAELLLIDALRITKEDLLRHPDRPVPSKRLGVYQEHILRRGRHEPIATIVGTKEFFGRAFLVTRHVLVPRPESELLVEEMMNQLPADRPVTIADIGTGSGCLAVSLAAELPHARIVATDISPDALRVARKNAERHHVTPRIRFLLGDLLRPVARFRLDGIVVNLPYVPEEEIRANPDVQFEPIIALRGRLGPERTLAAFLAQWFERNQRPITLIEIHPNQTQQILREKEKISINVRIKKDLAGRDRLAILTSDRSTH